MKVFITRKIPAIAEEKLQKAGIETEVFELDRPIKKNELIKKAKNCSGLISLLTDKIDAEVINNFQNCKVIANYAVGFNNIDIESAKAKKIIVTNTPDILTDATADLTVALVLACARRITESERFLRKGKFKGWAPELLLGFELKNKTVGIIGAGRIGQAAAERLKAFGTEIIYFNKSKKLEFEKRTGAKKVRLDTLLKKSDIISLHVPLNSKTKNLLNRQNLELVKPSAIIVNTARGEVIEEDHLIKMLKKRKLFSAGFDVYQNEPNFNSELKKLENVVLLPHIGSATIEARNKMAELSADNVIAVLKGRKAITPVY